MLLHLWFAEYGDRIAGFLFEPIQGEAGVCNNFTENTISLEIHLLYFIYSKLALVNELVFLHYCVLVPQNGEQVGSIGFSNLRQ